MYNDKLKEKKIPLSNKQHMLRKHYTSLKDTNKKSDLFLRSIQQ